MSLYSDGTLHLTVPQQFVKGPETDKFSFEAALLLCVLANFHRSDAARLNPYLRKLTTCDDIEFYEKIIWATDFALNAAIRSVVLSSQVC